MLISLCKFLQGGDVRFDGAEGEGGTDSGADAALPRRQGLHPSADHLQEGQRPLL